MDKILTLEVEDSEQGVRLDRFLAVRAEDLTRSRIKNLIDQGLALVDGSPGKAAARLKTGQSVTLTVPAVVPAELTPDPEVLFSTLYQDADIIVINKPAGLVVHPAAGHQEGTLVHGLLAACPDLVGIGGEARPGIVHRLDKDTSGVMVAAKNDRAHQGMVEQFKNGGITKYYLAICRGWPRTDTGEIDAPIGRHPVRRKEMSTNSRSGRAALTRWEVLRRFGMGLSLLRLRILTGRTHQIRVHLSSIGFPIVGDPVYGVGLGGLKKGAEPLKGLVNRQMLHARHLGFNHPITGQAMEFDAPVPPDMARVLEILEELETRPV